MSMASNTPSVYNNASGIPPDPFYGQSPGPNGPYTRAFAVTPGQPLLTMARSLWIGAAGNLTIITRDQVEAITLLNVPVGLLRIWCRAVEATGTTATDIVGLA